MGLVLKTLAKRTTSNESECVLGAFDVSAWYFPFVNGMETERCRMSLKKRRAYALMTQEQLAEAAGATEALKAADPMQWVGLMNNLQNTAEEVVLAELIYN